MRRRTWSTCGSARFAPGSQPSELPSRWAHRPRAAGVARTGRHRSSALSRIVVTGASGVIGTVVTKALGDHELVPLDLPRSDVRRTDLSRPLEGADAVVHLVHDARNDNPRTTGLNRDNTVVTSRVSLAASAARTPRDVFRPAGWGCVRGCFVTLSFQCLTPLFRLLGATIRTLSTCRFQALPDPGFDPGFGASRPQAGFASSLETATGAARPCPRRSSSPRSSRGTRSRSRDPCSCRPSSPCRASPSPSRAGSPTRA